MLEKYSELTDGMNYNKAALIVGNGASISLSKNFLYNNLFSKAEEIGQLSAKLANIFNQLHTSNFESILNQLDITQKMNNMLPLPHILEEILPLFDDTISKSRNQIKKP